MAGNANYVDGGAAWVNDDGSLTFKPKNANELIEALKRGETIRIFTGDKSKNPKSPDYKVSFKAAASEF